MSGLWKMCVMASVCAMLAAPGFAQDSAKPSKDGKGADSKKKAEAKGKDGKAEDTDAEKSADDADKEEAQADKDDILERHRGANGAFDFRGSPLPASEGGGLYSDSTDENGGRTREWFHMQKQKLVVMTQEEEGGKINVAIYSTAGKGSEKLEFEDGDEMKEKREDLFKIWNFKKKKSGNPFGGGDSGGSGGLKDIVEAAEKAAKEAEEAEKKQKGDKKQKPADDKKAEK